jgi:hypothetical protein
MKLSGPIRILAVAVLTASFSAPVFASDANSNWTPVVSSTSSLGGASFNIPATPARMSPELALQVHDARTKRQARELGEYADTTTIEAELPDTAQQGRYQLHRIYSAPGSLAFKAVNFAGDSFVKTNVISRLLQSEVDHAKTADNADTAITTANYKFAYKGVQEVEGQPLCHVFQVKPRHNRVGLFKGTVYLNVYTAAMVRAEGRMVKSPSFFVKNIQFSQDYTEVDGFDLVSHIHSTADARIIGKTVVDITHSYLQARSIEQLQASSPEVQQQNPSFRTVSLANNER